jgi:hypothetical protein
MLLTKNDSLELEAGVAVSNIDNVDSVIYSHTV